MKRSLFIFNAILSKIAVVMFFLIIRYDEWQARRMVRHVELYLKLHAPH